jgi:arabinose-5-phosphate isomerase
MHSRDKILERAKLTLKLEGDSIHKLANGLGDAFFQVITQIMNSSGRVVITGVGKSADVGRKIVATLNSTGSPALFVHAGDAVHGDLGGIQSGDVVLCLSKSGRSAEVLALAPLLNAANHPLVAVTGSEDSPLARLSQHVLVAGVDPEACPFDLAPTTSTAVQMALGDAIALCLMEAKGFGAEDFAKNHPGGTLGKKLLTRVEDLLDSDRKPSVLEDSTLQEILLSMTSGRYGATAVVSNDGNSSIKGIITDGDLRRALEAGRTEGITASEIMTSSPLCISSDLLASKAATMMNERGVSQILVVDSNSSYLGLVHLHDLIREGIVN